MKALKIFRIRSNMTRSALAEKLSVDSSTVYRWETGIREPNLEMLKKIALVLNATEAELLNGPADNGELKFSFIFDMREVEAMEVRMNEFKVGTGDDDIFGVFRVPKNLSVDEIGAKFMNYLRAELAGDKVKRAELKKLEDGQN